MAKQSIFGRISTLVKANVNAMLDSAEDPQKMLDQLVRDYTNNIADAESAIAETIGNLRLLELTRNQNKVPPAFTHQWVGRQGRVLLQQPDRPQAFKLETVTRKPFPSSLAPLAEFAMTAAGCLKSNAIALAATAPGGLVTLGLGGGQPNRVDAVEIALGRANGHSLEGAVLASDAFFPFADNIEAAAAAGVSYIVQPGGSMRDAEVIEACDRLEVAMAFTGQRRFRH